jgi:hypothetical protein
MTVVRFYYRMLPTTTAATAGARSLERLARSAWAELATGDSKFAIMYGREATHPGIAAVLRTGAECGPDGHSQNRSRDASVHQSTPGGSRGHSAGSVAKHELRDWIEACLASFPRDGDAAALTETLHNGLSQAKLFCDKDSDCFPTALDSKVLDAPSPASRL